MATHQQAGGDASIEHPAATQKSVMRRVIAASMFGTALETYDLYLYGTAAALIFAPLFFPAGDPTLSLLLSLMTFSISFIARPIGSIVLGHYGDRIGRKKLLFLTLILMGLSTTAIGFLPTYASAGIAAPIILCVLRFVQGFAFAGEYSGSVLMLLEHAPPKQRGFYTSLNNTGPVFGFILSSGLFLSLSMTMSETDFVGWGWRIPFVASALLLIVGVYVRTRVPESPAFKKSVEQKAGAPRGFPVVELFRNYKKEVALTAGASIAVFGTFYMFTVFSLTYGTQRLGLPRAEVLSIAMLAVLTNIVAVPFAAWRSDRIGRRKTLLQGFGFIALASFPFWYLFNTASYVPMLIGSCLIMIAYSSVYGVISSFVAEQFGTSVRFSGSAISYNLGGIVGGSAAPIVSTSLVEAYHTPYAVAAYISAIAIISAVCVYLLPETQDRELSTTR